LTFRLEDSADEMSTEQTYLDFASKISFFEFGKEGFRKSDLDPAKLQDEIQLLQSRTDWNIDTLSDYVRENPKSFRVFEGIFQLMRFTDAQMIHFVFDVSKLNLAEIEPIYIYAVYNLKNDEYCRRLFVNKILEQTGKMVSYEEVVSKEREFTKPFVVAIFKMVVSEYVEAVSGRFEILENRIRRSEFADFSVRFAGYVLDTLELNRMLRGIKVAEFLSAKLVPVDTKGLHGKFLKTVVQKALDRRGFNNIDGVLKRHNVNVLKTRIDTQVNVRDLPKGMMYCTEKYIEGVEKPNGGGRKKFDIVILSNFEPKHAFELNFYTTEGTKIGINEEEYLSLHETMRERNTTEFHWITDGNYWLSPNGRKRFERLYPRFGAIYNANTFLQHLDEFD
jgi:hypothetical protein